MSGMSGSVPKAEVPKDTADMSFTEKLLSARGDFARAWNLVGGLHARLGGKTACGAEAPAGPIADKTKERVACELADDLVPMARELVRALTDLDKMVG